MIKMGKRLFVALRVTPNQKMKELLNFLDNFQSTKTVKPENLHINLKFLGETPQNKQKDAEEALKELEGHGSFEAKLEKIGAFPNTDFIKVIWIGINSPEIRKIARKTEKEYIKRGFNERDKNYKPHITMARVKSKPNPEIKRAFTEKYNKLYKSTKFNEVELIESKLKKTGPIYETIAKAKL